MKKVLLLGLGAAIVLLGLGVAALAVASSALGAVPAWVELSAAPPQFHLRTAAPRLHFRESGFQDPRYELLFLPPDADAFLRDHQLTRGAPAAPATHDAPVKATAAVELEGLGDDMLSRSGQLWQVDGRTWVYLVAVGT